MRSNRILPYPEGTACAEVLLAAEDGAGEGRYSVSSPLHHPKTPAPMAATLSGTVRVATRPRHREKSPR